MTKDNLLDLDALSPKTRARVQNALQDERDTSVSLKFKNADVLAWRKNANARGLTMTEWMEIALNGVAGVRSK